MSYVMRDDYYYESFNGNKVSESTLHDKIMDAWKTVDDIKLLAYSAESLTQDQLMNAMFGLEIFASMRFEELWQCYEQMMHNKRKDKGFETPPL
jgi:hypothetical protein